MEQVGIADDFFDLGGDSLAAMRILDKIFKNWGVEITPKAFLEAGSVSATARLIVTKAAAGVDPARLGQLVSEIEAEPEPRRQVSGATCLKGHSRPVDWRARRLVS